MSDVSVGVKMLKVCIPKSKIDQLLRKDEARSSASTCPVKMLEHYIHTVKIDKMDTELFVFRPITKSKMSEYLRAGSSLGYSTLRELFKKKMRDLGYPAENFGIHLGLLQCMANIIITVQFEVQFSCQANESVN